MRRTAYQTAILLAVMLKRSGNSRVRVSQTTLKKLSGRERLRAAFVMDISGEMSDLGVYFLELDNGAFALVSSKSLEGAKTATAKRYLQDYLPQLNQRALINFDELEWEILGSPVDYGEDDE